MIVNTGDLDSKDVYVIIGYKIFANTMELGFVETNVNQCGSIAGRSIVSLVMFIM